MPSSESVNSRLSQARDASIAVAAILALFCAKYLSAMLQQNAFWRTGAWYEFFVSPSPVATAGMLDPAALASYYQTLSISAGHQLLAAVNQWFGAETGTAVLYVVIALVAITAVYLIGLHVTGSRVQAFLIALLVSHCDALALGHIGACGHMAQHPGRDYLALGPILLGFYFLLNRRFYAYWLCLFAGFLFHLPHGSYAFAMLLPLTILWARHDRKFLVFHVASFALTALSLFLYQSAGGGAIDPAVREMWFKWVYIFNGGHIFFDHSIGYLVPNWAFLSTLSFGIALGIARREQRDVVASIVPVWILIALGTTFFVYVVPLMLVHQLTPYRSSLLVAAVLLIFMLKVLLEPFRGGAPLWKSILALIGLAAFASGTFAGVCLATIPAALLLASGQTGWRRNACYAAIAASASFLALTLTEYKSYDAYVVLWNRKTLAYAFVALAVLSAARAWRWTPGTARKLAVPLAFAAAVLVTLALPSRYIAGFLKLSAFILIGALAFLALRRWAANPEPLRRLAMPLAAAVAAVTIALIPSRYVSAPAQGSRDKLSDFLAASAVVRDNSSPSEPVLAAPLIDMPMLEVTAGRGSVLQLVKSHVVYLAPALLPRFDATLRGFGMDVRSFKGTWVDFVREAPDLWRKTATEARLRELGREHKARLVVTYEDHRLDLPVLHRGKFFAVYRVAE